MDTLDLDLIHDAEEFLRGRIRVTPVEPSPELSRVLGVPVTLKLEFLQLTGSFKLRGAFFRLSRLTFAERRAGVEGGIGKKCFSVLKPRVDRVALVTEEEVYAAFRWVIEQHQVLIEPTAAVVVAACLSGKVGRLDSPAAVVLSGRNVGIGTVKKLL